MVCVIDLKINFIYCVILAVIGFVLGCIGKEEEKMGVSTVGKLVSVIVLLIIIGFLIVGLFGFYLFINALTGGYFMR